MAIIKGLSGDVTLRTNGGAPRSFVNYGVTAGQTASFSVSAAHTAVLEDGTADLIQITQAPERGHLVARSDGRMSFNINDDITPGSLSFQYRKTTGGVSETVDATLTLTAPQYLNGWDKGCYYLPEVDEGAGTLVIEPSPVTRPIHFSPNGLTPGDLAAREGTFGSTFVNDAAEWCLRNAASGEGGAFYGETEALALSPEIAYRMARRITIAPGTYPAYGGVIWLLAERGHSYPEVNLDLASTNGVTDVGGSGYSLLHPNYFGAWGSGSKPYFEGKTLGFLGADRAVLENWDHGGATRILNSAHCLFSNVHGNFQHPESGSESPVYTESTDDNLNIDISFRNVRSLDVSRQEPQDASAPRTYWAGNPDRISGGYIGDTVNGLLDACFVDQCGWAPGYRADLYGGPDDQSTAWLPQPPSVFNQGVYIQVSTRAITVRDFITTRNSLSALQCRGAATVLGVFSAGNNAGITLGRGWYDDTTADDGPFIGHLNFADDTVHTHAGAKDTWSGEMSTTGQGHTYAGFDNTLLHSAVINAEWPFEVFANDQEFGPKSSATFLKNYNPLSAGAAHPSATLGRNEMVISNWNRSTYPDQNVGAVAEATRDALTIEGYTDALLSQTGSTLDDLCAHLRTLEQPSTAIRPILDHFLVPLGKGRSTRTVAQTVTFRPDAGGGTPGVRADVRWDWTSFDLPGDVAGDSVDLAGHKVAWQITPKGWIDDLTFGAGGALEMFGGALKPQGNVIVASGGNRLMLDKGAKFDLPGYAGPNRLEVEAQESRFMNRGDVAGKVDITARFRAEVIFGYDTASFTAGAGDTVTIYGHSDCGFDGALGGTASLTFAAGATLAFKPLIHTPIWQRPKVPAPIQLGFSGPAQLTKRPEIYAKVGTTITGSTSGARARVAYMTRVERAVLDEIEGTFVADELFDGTGEALYTIDQGAVSDLGQIKTAAAQLGRIGKVRTGLNGFNAPNVTANVTLGGTLHLDVNGVANGDYALMEVDSISGSFDAITAAGNGTKDLTVTVTGTDITLNVADGTGQVSVA